MTDQRTIPSHVDSVEKILYRLALISKEPISYNGRRLKANRPVNGHHKDVEIDPPDSLTLSPSLLRNFTCVSGCTACCLPFTLDFTNDEFNQGSQDWKEEVDNDAIDLFTTRIIQVNGEDHPIQSYPQYKDDKCPFLRPVREDGNLGCSFWPHQPIECAAAPQVLMTTRGLGNTVIMKKGFGYGWKWQIKPECEFTDIPMKKSDIPAEVDMQNSVYLFERYLHWAEYVGVETWIPEILEVLPDLPDIFRSQTTMTGYEIIQ